MISWLLAFLAYLFSAFARLLSSANRPPRACDRSISPQWLTRVLHDQATLPTHLSVAKTELVGLDNAAWGLAGGTLRLRVTYSRPLAAPAAPASFILKMSGFSISERRSSMLCGKHREGQFYASSYARAMPRGLVPEVVYAYGSARLGESLVLMEDMQAVAGAVGLQFVLANQKWRLKAGDLPPAPLEAQLSALRLVFGRAAEIHARFWRDRSLLSQSWLKGADWYNGKGRWMWERSINRARECWAQTKRRYLQTSSPAVKLDPDLVKIIDESFAITSWDKLQAHLHDPAIPWTLCHGDFHAANMFLVKETERQRLVWFDWSEVGPWEPTTDLAQMIISDVSPDLSALHSRSLVESYWKTLTGAGVDPSAYPLSVCWAAFVRGGAERWIWVFSVLSAFLPAADAVQYFHDQLLAFLRQHNAMQPQSLKPVVCLL